MRVSVFVYSIFMCFTLALTLESTVCAQFFPQQGSGLFPAIQSPNQPYSRSLTAPNSPNGLTPNFDQARQSIADDSASTMVSRRNARTTSDSLARLSRLDTLQRSMPQMFADSPAAPLSVVVNDGLIATADLPLAGGARRMKVAANNRALPQDRIIFQYQLFVNALNADASRFRVRPASRTIDLNQYTIGFEKTFAEGLASIDVRMPFTNEFELATPNFGVEGGQIGNLNVKLKAALLLEQTYCFSTGLGFEAPTGSSVSFQGNGFQHVVDNNAFFLQPFLAYEKRTGDWFLNAFTSVDVALNGNSFRNAFLGQPVLGRINDQTLGTFSIGGGRWLFFDPSRRILNGFAMSSELNYTTTFQDSDSVQNVSFQTVTVQNLSNRSDHLNCTLGGQLSLGSTSLRFGFVQPLRTGDDRLFDHEFNVQLNRLF